VAQRFEKIGFRSADTPEAQAGLAELRAKYPHVPADQADVIVALGGDGFMLETLHSCIHRPVPIYGMNLGTVGFLLNEYDVDHLEERLAQGVSTPLHPLRMRVTCSNGKVEHGLGINEVSLFRETRQAASIAIAIDGVVRLDNLVCDGILVATPAGSTAYNLSPHGPILPVGANLLALTPISAFRPRRWRGALLPDRAVIQIDILEANKRPVSAVADHFEVRSVSRVTIRMDMSSSIVMLFDPGHSLDERILAEQFG
jgi:NAD+ kinase